MVKKKTTKKVIEKKEEPKKSNSLKINYWMIASVVLVIVLSIVLIANSTSGISKKKAESIVLTFLTERYGLDSEDIQFNSIISKGDIFIVEFLVQGDEGEFAVSKDGKYFGQMIESSSFMGGSITGNVVDTPQEIPKSDKPRAELFIMTHCPYGTQAEKGFIPFLESIGNKADAKIRFVHYFMHEPEYTETPRQLCIREEQSDKFIPYLKCFLEGNGVVDQNYGLIMEGKNPEECMKIVGIDIAKVNSCIDSEKWEDYYEEDSLLSQSYGVQGSPTLILNGVQVNSGRSPAAYLSAVCDAFNNAPEECSTLSLSSATPSPYFGWEGVDVGASGGYC